MQLILIMVDRSKKMQKNSILVEDFIATIIVYNESENMSDNHAFLYCPRAMFSVGGRVFVIKPELLKKPCICYVQHLRRLSQIGVFLMKFKKKNKK